MKGYLTAIAIVFLSASAVPAKVPAENIAQGFVENSFAYRGTVTAFRKSGRTTVCHRLMNEMSDVVGVVRRYDFVLLSTNRPREMPMMACAEFLSDGQSHWEFFPIDGS